MKCRFENKRVVKICPYCGKIFKSPKWKNKKFCSHECSLKYHSGEESPHWKTKIKKVCPTCGKIFYVMPSREGRKFCCKKCYLIYHAVDMIKAKCKNCEKIFLYYQNHPHKFCSRKCYLEYVNSHVTNFYNLNEYKLWIIKVFKRDNYTCQICGNNKKLNAHHIYPKRKYPELIYYVDNGITLCRKHHSYFTWHEESFIDFFERIRGDIIVV